MSRHGCRVSGLWCTLKDLRNNFFLILFQCYMFCNTQDPLLPTFKSISRLGAERGYKRGTSASAGSPNERRKREVPWVMRVRLLEPTGKRLCSFVHGMFWKKTEKNALTPCLSLSFPCEGEGITSKMWMHRGQAHLTSTKYGRRRVKRA